VWVAARRALHGHATPAASAAGGPAHGTAPRVRGRSAADSIPAEARATLRRFMSATTTDPVIYRSSAARPGTAHLVVEGFRDVLSRRRLIRYLVQADLKKKGSDTFLGNVWWILDPLLQMMVYVILVSVIFNRGGPDYALFVFSAILPWKWFTSSVNDAISSVTSQERLIKQLQFPKIVLPVSGTFAGVISFSFGLVPLAAILVLLFPHRISPYLVFLPAIAGVQLVFTLGLALLVATANVFVRDVTNIARHVLRLWFYLSPGLYSLSLVTESNLGKEFPALVSILRLNPFAVLFEAYRAVIYGTADGGPPTMPNLAALGLLLLFSAGLVVIGTAVFKRLEPTFAKVV
jgi:lipopolysaccharide transport system permease protein/teichoic acid transport system permease protein